MTTLLLNYDANSNTVSVNTSGDNSNNSYHNAAVCGLVEDIVNDVIRDRRLDGSLDTARYGAAWGGAGAPQEMLEMIMTVSMPIRTFSSSTLESLPRNEQGGYMLNYLNTMDDAITRLLRRQYTSKRRVEQ